MHRRGAQRALPRREASSGFVRQVPAFSKHGRHPSKNDQVITHRRASLVVESRYVVDMPRDVRILHGGELALEVAAEVEAALRSKSIATQVFQLGKYRNAGFDIVDVSSPEATTTAVEDAPRDNNASRDDDPSTSPLYLFVVETYEFENPGAGAVTLLRDLLAAAKKSKDTTKQWEVRMVDDEWSGFTDRDTRTADPITNAYDGTRARLISDDGNTRKLKRVQYATIAVGDNDATRARAAFRSKQCSASDCNQAGQLFDKLFSSTGGVRVASRLEIDVSRDTVREQVEAWMGGEIGAHYS